MRRVLAGLGGLRAGGYIMLPRIRNSGEFRSQLKKLLMTTGKYSVLAYLPFARRTTVYFFLNSAVSWQARVRVRLLRNQTFSPNETKTK